MVRWPQKSRQEDTLSCFCSEAAGVLLQDALCDCHHGPPRYTVQGSLGGVRDHRVGGLCPYVARGWPLPQPPMAKRLEEEQVTPEGSLGAMETLLPPPPPPPDSWLPLECASARKDLFQGQNQGEESEALAQNLKDGWRKSESSR